MYVHIYMCTYPPACSLIAICRCEYTWMYILYIQSHMPGYGGLQCSQQVAQPCVAPWEGETNKNCINFWPKNARLKKIHWYVFAVSEAKVVSAGSGLCICMVCIVRSWPKRWLLLMGGRICLWDFEMAKGIFSSKKPGTFGKAQVFRNAMDDFCCCSMIIRLSLQMFGTPVSL